MITATKSLKLQQVEADIARHGFLPARRSVYLRRKVDLYGPSRVIPASRTIAGRLAKPGQPRPRSTVTTVGAEGLPSGIGSHVLWDPRDSALALVVFLNASDSTGVMISGAQPTDTIEFVFADGLASFAEDTKNEHIPALIGLIATGASATAAAFGAPEAKPFIDGAAKFAQEVFKEEKVRTKVRDPFGEDPATGGKAEQEGGVVLSLPEAGKSFHSGNKDHRERWIKPPGSPRNKAHQPDHMHDAFFLQGRQRFRTNAAGDFAIYAWDHAFSDNFGFYRLHVLTKRGDGQRPGPDID